VRQYYKMLSNYPTLLIIYPLCLMFPNVSVTTAFEALYVCGVPFVTVYESSLTASEQCVKYSCFYLTDYNLWRRKAPFILCAVFPSFVSALYQ
jgi:hypothetical protein